MNVFNRIGHRRDVAQPHRIAVALRNDQRAILVGVPELIGRVEHPRPVMRLLAR